MPRWCCRRSYCGRHSNLYQDASLCCRGRRCLPTSVPMKLPSIRLSGRGRTSVFCTGELHAVDRCCPEITLPAPVPGGRSIRPPIVLLEAARPRVTTPSRLSDRRAFPVMSVPMKLPCDHAVGSRPSRQSMTRRRSTPGLSRDQVPRAGTQCRRSVTSADAVETRRPSCDSGPRARPDRSALMMLPSMATVVPGVWLPSPMPVAIVPR